MAARYKVMTNKLVQNFILYKLSKTRTTNVLPTASYLESVDADIKDSHGDLFEMTARTLQNVAVKMESRYSDFFEITIRTMTCNLDDVMEFSQSYSAIVTGMFSGNVINWERIAVLFTFSGQLAIYCEKQQRSPIYADKIILLLAQFVNTENTELFKWIQNAGGWKSFNENFREHVNEHLKLTRELAEYFIWFKLGKVSAANVSLTARTLRRVAGEVESSHGDLFQCMIQTITCESDDISQSFPDIMKSMFSDNVITWGRIAVLFTLSGQVAIHCEKVGSPREDADLIISLLTDFVNSRLLKWIENAGGWESFNEHFKERKRDTGVWWSDVLCTVGLVAGAAGAALVFAR